MEPFKFIRVSDAQAAFAGAALSGSKFIAGGTNLIDLMKLNIERPTQLVDINNLKLTTIERLPNGNMRIGALVTNTDVAYNPLIKQNYPVLSEALLSGATAQLRNKASVGGNLMQRTRCPYFYDTEFPCNKREPGSGCSSIPGYNRSNAILGTSDHCIAFHPSDMCVAMAALGTVINLSGPRGSRTVHFTDFYLKPGTTPHLEHVIKHDELITSVEIPAIAYGSKSHYLKVRDRASYEFALTSAAVAMDVQNGRIIHVNIALGGVGTVPWRAKLAEKVLLGAVAGEQIYRTAAEAELSQAKGFSDNSFKIELAKRTIVRALTTVGKMS